NPLFKLRKAQAYSAVGKLKEAISLLNELERGGIPSVELLLTKASVFSQLRDSVNAIKYYKASLADAEPEDRDEIYLDLAMEYQNKGDIRSALRVLKEAIKSNPNNEGAIYEIAFCYDQLGDFEKSIECYSGFINDNPYSFTAWYNLGNAYSKMEDFEKAIWAYDYCVLINDDFGPAHFNLGHANLGLDKYKKAIECFDKSIELDGDDPTTFCYIGECHEQLGELDLAKHFYKRSLDLSPLLADAWLGLGIVADLEGKTKEGITLILKAGEIDPENAGIFHVLAGAYEKLEDREKADEYYQLSLALDAKDEECLLNYVNLLSDDSNIDALDYLSAFEDTSPGNCLLPVLKVNLLWKLGETDAALNLYKKCLEIDRDKALELFDLYPALKNVTEFVLLADQ
ncbi:MAG: tetratricopeptide repeat protein, partial [Crocinitomicaceae bacterium]|nr:tetratricopeptide repeat protein [Crocinitomicaceae bacterium]